MSLTGSAGVPTRAPVARIDLMVGAVELLPGDTVTATAQAFSGGGDPVPLLDFSWQLSDSSVASVEVSVPQQTALVTAFALGGASLTAQIGGVTSAPVHLIVVEPGDNPAGGT